MASSSQAGVTQPEHSLQRNQEGKYGVISKAEGNFLYPDDDGHPVFDACGGAAVSCLGYSNKQVIEAMKIQIDKICYAASTTWDTTAGQKLFDLIIEGTDNKMAGVYFFASGSEAMEAAIKMSIQYFSEKGPEEEARVNFISRHGSYHGNTLGALAVSGFKARRKIYERHLKPVEFVSPCYPYRQQGENVTDEAFVQSKVEELEAAFRKLGEKTVVAFIAEPIVGAALGVVPYVPGYLEAMKAVCEKHGALLILDEVMCGMGRTGDLHAWQATGVVPDIQTIGKALAGGYQPIAAMLTSHKVANVLKRNDARAIHGTTFQGTPLQAATAFEVQKVIQEKELLKNVKKQGKLLGELLNKELKDHPNVGDIRGRGLLWGLEFVKDKNTKAPFDPSEGVAQNICDVMISELHMTVYPNPSILKDNTDPKDKSEPNGDTIIIAPAYNVDEENIRAIVYSVAHALKRVFRK